MNTVKKEIYLWLINIDHCRTQIEASWTIEAGLCVVKNAISFSDEAMSNWNEVESKIRSTNMETIDGIDITVFHKRIHGSNMDAYVLPQI